MAKQIFSDQTVSISMPAPLLLSIEKTRQKLMRQRKRAFLSRSALFREATEMWLQEMNTADKSIH